MDASNIDVSVIVITYNHKAYIRQALDSILMQKTDYRFEILIGDDASTDGTSDIVREYAQKHPDIIRPFIREQNLGSASNAYETLRMARGRYLATCEGDDCWMDPEKLQIQVDFMQKNPKYVGCVHRVGLMDEAGRRLPRKRLEWTSDKRIFSLKDFRGVVLPGHVVSMVRRNFFLEPGFDDGIIRRINPNIADRTCALLWLARGDFYRLDKEMACYRYVRNGSNLTSVMYNKNSRRFEADYEYTLALEAYAEQVLHVDGGFSYHKRELFAKSVIYAILHPGKGRWELPEKILKNADKPLWYVGGIFSFLFQRMRGMLESRKK